MSTAWAQTAEATSNMSILMSYAPIIFIIGIFYLVVMRPQAQAAKARAEMLKSIGKGATVVLQAGMVGTIKSVHEKTGLLEIEFLPNNTTMLVERSSIDRLYTESLPAKAAPEASTTFKKKR